MTKIVIEIHLKKMLAGKMVAKQLATSIQKAVEGVITHPAIEKVESRVEPGL